MRKVLITGAFGFVGSNLSAYLSDRGCELWALDVVGAPDGAGSIGLRPGSNAALPLVQEIQNSEGVQDCESAEMKESLTETQRSQSVYEQVFSWEQLGEIPWSEVDAVIHLAGKAHDTKNTSEAQSYFDINTGLTKTVLEWFSRQGAEAQRGERKFILFSSVKAVADRVEGVLTEEAQPDPQTPYGQSKLEAEEAVRECASSKVLKCEDSARVGDVNRISHRSAEGTEEDKIANQKNFRTSELQNFRTYILRPCMIHGPGNKGNLNLLYNVVRRGIPWLLGAFENQRSFASVANICAVVEGLLREDVESGIFHVADDEAISTNELIAMIAESQGRSPRILRISEGVVSLVARMGDVLHLPLNSERLKKLTESYVVSNAKIKRALGWDKMPVRAKEGMLQTLKSFSEN